MIPQPAADLWQPCDLDVRDGICLPYVSPDAINIYVVGQVTALTYVTCAGVETAIPLGNTDYVIAEDDKGGIYTYITNITLPEGAEGCFSLMVTADGNELFTPCYLPAGNCATRRANKIESSFAKYDCLKRWYGEPQNVIAGDATLLFSNATYIWGSLYNEATNFEFTNFKDCIVTKTKQQAAYLLQANSIPPYLLNIVEPILGRGIVEVNNVQYAVQSGTHFERIIGVCRSQYDMNIRLTDCGCEVNHDCDLEFEPPVPPPCVGSLAYECSRQLEESAQVLPNSGVQLGRVGTTFLINTNTDILLADDIAAVIDNAVNLGYYLVRLQTAAGTLWFYAGSISAVTQIGDTVTFQYDFSFISNLNCNATLITDTDFPDGSFAGVSSGNSVSSFSAAITVTATVTGSTVLAAVWSVSAPFTQIDLLTISIPLPVGAQIDISVDITPERCGELTLEVVIDDSPTTQWRFLGAEAGLSFTRGGSDELVCTGGYLAANTTVVSESWQALPIPGGTPYSGGSPTTGTGSSFILQNVGLTDDILIRYTVTDVFGNTSIQSMLFGQNSNAPDEDITLRCNYGTLDGVVGTVLSLTPAAVISNTYVPAITMDELGLDFDNSGTYEQTTDANTPASLSHDYATLGVYTGVISVSTDAGLYPAIPFGLVRCTFTFVLY